MTCMQNPNSNVKMRRIGALEEDEGDDDDDGSDPEMESMGEEEEDDEMNDFDKVLVAPQLPWETVGVKITNYRIFRHLGFEKC